MKNALDFLLNFKTNIGGVGQKIKKEFPKVTRVISDGSKSAQDTIDRLDIMTDMAFEHMTQNLKDWAKDFIENTDSISESIDKMQGQFGAFGGGIMQTITSPGMAASAALYKAFEAASDLEKTQQILKRTTNLTSKEFDALYKEIVRLNKEEGVALSQGGHFVAALSEAGFSAEDLTENMHVLAQMHHAFGTDTQMLTGALATMKQTVGLTGDQFEEFGTQIGVMAKAGKNINTDDMTQSIAQFSEIAASNFQHLAKVSGKSTAELTMDLGEQFARLGVIGKQGAAQLTTQFAEGISDRSSDAYRQMAIFGGQAFQDAIASGDIEGAMDSVLGGIGDMAGRPEFQQLASQFEDVFGLDAGIAQKIALSEESLFSFDKEVTKSKDQIKSLADAAHDNQTSFESFMRQVNKFTAAMLPLGESIMSIINIFTPLVGVLAEAFNGLMQFIDSIPGGNAALLLLLASLTGIDGIVKSLAAKFLGLFTNFSMVTGFIRKVALSVFEKLLAIGGAIKKAFIIAGKAVRLFGTALRFVGRAIIAAFTALLGPILGTIAAVVAALYGIYEVVKLVFGIDLIDEYVAYFKWGWGIVGDVFDAVVGGIKSAWDNTIGFIISGIASVSDMIGGAFDWLFGEDEEKKVTIDYSTGKAPDAPLAITGPSVDKSSINLADFGVKQSNETEREASVRESVELQREMVNQLVKGNDDRDAKQGESYARRHN